MGPARSNSQHPGVRCSFRRSTLSADELAHFRTHGFVHVRDALTAPRRAALVDWVDDMEGWPESPGRWMKYFEDIDRQRRALCRMEHFLEYHPGLNALLGHEQLMHILAQLMGEPATLFKEKINFKLPGGNGFAPHQDAPAFAAFGQRYHITALICIDDAHPDNGCLELATDPCAGRLLPQAADGTIRRDAAQSLNFQPICMRSGDVLLFDSFLPHRSGENRSDGPRRAAYVTYNRLSEGSCRAAYYRDKRAKFPPECERIPGFDYSAGAAMYNLANPIRL